MARKAKLGKAERLNRAITRWESKQESAVIMLRKSAEELLKLRRQRRRMLERETTRLTIPKTFDTTPPAVVAEAIKAGIDDGLDIPAILDRTRKLQAMADPKTKEKKAERRAVEKEKREAELTGKRRKMPPTGKAAIQKILSE